MNNHYRIVPDPEYGYLRIDPLPSQEEVDLYYAQEFYAAHTHKFNDSSIQVQTEQRNFFDSRWEEILSVCEEYFGRVKGLSLFDLGFGYAQALLYFRTHGLEVCGLEPTNEGFEYARGQGIDAYRAGIEEFECVGDRRFDIVTVIDVLEHLRRPADTLIKVREKLLKPGGMIVIDVPNDFNAFQRAADEEYGLHQWWVCPPNHINYFSGSMLKNLLRRCGYETRRCIASFPLEIFLLMGDVYVGNEALGRSCHEKRARFEEVLRRRGTGAALRRLYEALGDLDLGRQVVVFAVPSAKS